MLEQHFRWDYQWSQVVGRAWADGDFKQRLIADPTGALKEYELELPAGRRVQVLEGPEAMPEDTDEVKYLFLPTRPSDDALSEDDLVSVGGAVGVDRCWGWCHRCAHCVCAWCGRCGCHHPPRPDEG